MQNADGIVSEIDEADLYVFNSERKFIAEYNLDKISDDATIRIPLPKPDKYHFVVWAKSNRNTDEMSDFDFGKMDSGSSIEDCNATLKRHGNAASFRLNNLLNGYLDADVSGESRRFIVDMRKCTNSIRIILLPIRSSQQLKSEDYSISITDYNARLNWQGRTINSDIVEYTPYRQVLEKDASPDGKEEINNAVVADFSTSRIIYGANARLRVYNRLSQHEILNINLPWLLTLQGIGEKLEWGNQEYLDRQDNYSITFFIDDTTWLTNRIIINGWILSIENADLK